MFEWEDLVRSRPFLYRSLRGRGCPSRALRDSLEG